MIQLQSLMTSQILMMSLLTSVVSSLAYYFTKNKNEKISSQLCQGLHGLSKIPPGIENYGNTCFVNSILQSLASIPSLIRFLQVLKKQAEIHKQQESSIQFVVELLKSLVKLNDNEIKNIQVSSLISTLKNQDTYISFQDQQDSHELLLLMFDLIDQAYQFNQQNTSLQMLSNSLLFSSQLTNYQQNPLLGYINTQLGCYKFLSHECNPSIFWFVNQYFKRLSSNKGLGGHYHMDYGLFSYGQIDLNIPLQISQIGIEPQKQYTNYQLFLIECSQCQSIFNIRLESFNILSLEITKPDVYSLQQCIDQFTKSEKIEGVYCMNCSAQTFISENNIIIKKICEDQNIQNNISLIQMIQEQNQLITQLTSSSYIEHEEIEGKIAHLKSKQVAQLTQSQQNQIKYIIRPYQKQKRIVNKISYIMAYPKIVIFHFKRLVYDHFGYQRKIDKFIRFEEKEILLKKEYTLCSIVRHLGSSQSGHYITFRRAWHNQIHPHDQNLFQKSSWYFTSDQNIHIIDKKQVLMNEAYLLMYEIK